MIDKSIKYFKSFLEILKSTIENTEFKNSVSTQKHYAILEDLYNDSY